MNLDTGDTRLILKEAKARGLSLDQAAYVLATTWHETAKTMKPVREAYWMSEQWRKDNLRYYPWYGRGYVQLTWRSNYEKAGDKLGADLTSTPDAVMEPTVSAKILVRGMMEGWFTGATLPDYVNEDKVDFVGARRVVNGTDKAATIAKYADEYRQLLKADGYGQASNPLAALIAAITAFLKSLRRA